MKFALALLIMLITLGCAKEPYKLPRPHPTMEQIWAHTDPNFKPEANRVKLRLSVYPVLPLVYNDVRVTCILPNVPGYYEFGEVNRTFRYSGENNGQRIHYMNIGCMPIEFYCSFQEYIPQQGYAKAEIVRLSVTPVGECR